MINNNDVEIFIKYKDNDFCKHFEKLNDNIDEIISNSKSMNDIKKAVVMSAAINYIQHEVSNCSITENIQAMSEFNRVYSYLIKDTDTYIGDSARSMMKKELSCPNKESLYIMIYKNNRVFEII